MAVLGIGADATAVETDHAFVGVGQRHDDAASEVLFAFGCEHADRLEGLENGALLRQRFEE